MAEDIFGIPKDRENSKGVLSQKEIEDLLGVTKEIEDGEKAIKENNLAIIKFSNFLDVVQSHIDDLQFIYKKSDYYTQNLKLIEELAELTVELSKKLNGYETSDIESEMADVLVLLCQLLLSSKELDTERVESEFELKIARQIKRINCVYDMED
jgi:NTP pyrophosphatase (non-canonical NTP hydrolase)